MGKSCDSYISFTNCVNAARAEELVGETLPSVYIKRCEVYDLFIKAADIPLVAKSDIDESELPSDLTMDDPCVQTWVTARKYGIASLYLNNRSKAAYPLFKYQITMFARRTQRAMAKIAAGEL